MGQAIKYSRDVLADAVAKSVSYNEVMQHLGLPQGKGSSGYVATRIRRLGLDTSHFTGKRVYTREVLAEAVANSTSFAGVLRQLGRVQAGGTQAHIARMIRNFDLDTSHFRRDQGARASSSARRSAADVLVLDLGAARRVRPHLLRRVLVETGREYSCEVCGCSGTWQGGPLTLHIDHISGDFRDNRAENLRFLCPNCHAQTPTFAGRGRGFYSSMPPTMDVVAADRR